MPLPNILEFIGNNVTQAGFKAAQEKLLNFLSGEAATKVELSAAVTQKADKTYVDNALSEFQGGSTKFYVTLAEANADIANIMPKLTTDNVKDLVNIGEVANGGVWYKASSSATSLTKSPYDPRIQAKQYTDVKINELGVDHTDSTEEYSVQTVDEDGIRTWLEADGKGEPTKYAAEVICNKVGVEHSTQENFSAHVVDEDGTRTWLEADGKGEPTDYAIECIQRKLAIDPNSVVTHFKSSYNSEVIPIVSGPNISCYGDSMTRGAGATYPYSHYLQQLFIQNDISSLVRNCGVGGESSETICARQGGNPFLVKVNSGAISADASTLNPITLLSQGGTTAPPAPLLQGSGNPFEDIGYFKGTLYGIEGQIHPHDGGYVFVRDTNGSAVVANRPTYFYTNYSQELRDDIQIIWVGQNSNPALGLDDARAIRDAKAMIRHLKPIDKRYLVINKPISTPDEDKNWYAEFGDRYIPARSYLIQFGLEDAGITPTQQDLDSIAAGYVPNSLRYDNVHWNDHGYEILANLIFKKLKQLGWI
ncbi:SGNH/GDSL hydrolase family protein [uncultured Acinetobacter sp.]|uniref:SGNH/GDSL hydrolase family protein n=1 Tax=uncultured Acinetobacter sp. TaxID=165433 RepID=UPI00258CBB06|nr:SGNH/GDSL hydrolase family protein [uncultured Acinetobacter sp.]